MYWICGLVVVGVLFYLGTLVLLSDKDKNDVEEYDEDDG